MSTNSFSAKDIKRSWHLVDAKDEILGRLATRVATILMGKNKPSFVPFLDNGDYVVVTNAAKVKVSGKKAQAKKYFRHSGYPGGDTTETFDSLVIRKPEYIISEAVKGMLPKTKLGKLMIKKLFVSKDEKHKFESQLRVNNNG